MVWPYWGAHDNNARTLLHELIRFDETLAYIYEWIKNRNDTFLIVTADHETGGFGFSYSRKNIPKANDFPGTVFKGKKFKPNFNFGCYDILDKIYHQKSSYQSMIDEFDALPEEQQTSGAMKKIVNTNNRFPITEAEASAILEEEINIYYDPNHRELNKKLFPKINDFKEFYVYGESIRKDILGRIVAKQQNVVWSTGTHTNTPVPLIAWGPKKVTEKFSRILHTTEWARYAIDALSND